MINYGRRIRRSHTIRSSCYTESTLYKILCKKRDQIATDDKNKIVYEIDPKNCEAVSFGESKRTLKLHPDQHKRSVRNHNKEKIEIAKKEIITLAEIRRKLLIGKAG